MISTILFIGFIVGVSFLGIYVPITVAERKQQKTCPGCIEGTVLFTEREQRLCHKHSERRYRIDQLEKEMDFETRREMGRTEQDIREEALDMLLGKLDQNRDKGYPVKMKIAGEWVQIGRLPKEPGAVSPKPDGSR